MAGAYKTAQAQATPDQQFWTGLVQQVGDHEICVRAVDQPGPGANELVTVVRKQLEVDEDFRTLRRGEPLAASGDERDGDRV